MLWRLNVLHFWLLRQKPHNSCFSYATHIRKFSSHLRFHTPRKFLTFLSFHFCHLLLKLCVLQLCFTDSVCIYKVWFVRENLIRYVTPFWEFSCFLVVKERLSRYLHCARAFFNSLFYELFHFRVADLFLECWLQMWTLRIVRYKGRTTCHLPTIILHFCQCSKTWHR